MSNVIFQPPAGLSWSIKKRPRYATITQTPTSARGQLRMAKQQYPIWEYEMNWNYLTGSEQAAIGANSGLQQLMGFFMARQGAYDDFLYSDPNDNSVTGMPFGTGDGATTSFQLQRNIGSGVDIVQNVDTSKSQPRIYKYDWQGTKNLLSQSENIAASPWAANTAAGIPAPIITANAAFAPDGSNNATKIFLQPVGSSQWCDWRQQLPSDDLSSRTFSASIWLRADLPTTMTLNIGQASSPFTSNTTVCALTPQWQRFSVTLTFPSGVNIPTVFMRNNPQIGPAASCTFYAWGGQLEENASTTIYQKTGTNNWGPTLQYATPRTNLLTWSGDITNPQWILEGTATRSAGAATAPDGISSAQQLNCGATAGSDIYNVSAAPAANGTQWTGSVWLKSPTSTPVSVQVLVDRNGGADAEIQSFSVGPVWKRCTVTHSPNWTGTTGVTLAFRMSTANTSVHIWGAQLEQGTTGTSYIPTTTGTITVTDYTLGMTGIVTFFNPPAASAVVSWDGGYLYRVHFAEDMNEFDEFMYQLWELQSVKLESAIV